MDKVVASAADAVADIGDGASLAVGGFGMSGVPTVLIAALLEQGATDLETISNNLGVDGFGLGTLLAAGRIRRTIGSYVGNNKEFARQYLAGELELELTPQGTLAERLRAGGAGIPAFYTATGAGTLVAEGKESRAFFRPSQGIGGATIPGRGFAGRPATSAAKPAAQGGTPREYVLETGLYADLALVKAHTADPFGNLVYRKTARNFNPMMATAAAFVIAEVEDVVDLGAIDGDDVHTPGSFIDRIIKTVPTKRIEQRTVARA